MYNNKQWGKCTLLFARQHRNLAEVWSFYDTFDLAEIYIMISSYLHDF